MMSELPPLLFQSHLPEPQGKLKPEGGLTSVDLRLIEVMGIDLGVTTAFKAEGAPLSISDLFKAYTIGVAAGKHRGVVEGLLEGERKVADKNQVIKGMLSEVKKAEMATAAAVDNAFYKGSQGEAPEAFSHGEQKGFGIGMAKGLEKGHKMGQKKGSVDAYKGTKNRFQEVEVTAYDEGNAIGYKRGMKNGLARGKVKGYDQMIVDLEQDAFNIGYYGGYGNGYLYGCWEYGRDVGCVCPSGKSGPTPSKLPNPKCKEMVVHIARFTRLIQGFPLNCSGANLLDKDDPPEPGCVSFSQALMIKQSQEIRDMKANALRLEKEADRVVLRSVVDYSTGAYSGGQPRLSSLSSFRPVKDGKGWDSGLPNPFRVKNAGKVTQVAGLPVNKGLGGFVPGEVVDSRNPIGNETTKVIDFIDLTQDDEPLSQAVSSRGIGCYEENGASSSATPGKVIIRSPPSSEFLGPWVGAQVANTSNLGFLDLSGGSSGLEASAEFPMASCSAITLKRQAEIEASFLIEDAKKRKALDEAWLEETNWDEMIEENQAEQEKSPEGGQ